MCCDLLGSFSNYLKFLHVWSDAFGPHALWDRDGQEVWLCGMHPRCRLLGTQLNFQLNLKGLRPFRRAFEVQPFGPTPRPAGPTVCFSSSATQEIFRYQCISKSNRPYMYQSSLCHFWWGYNLWKCNTSQFLCAPHMFDVLSQSNQFLNFLCTQLPLFTACFCHLHSFFRTSLFSHRQPFFPILPKPSFFLLHVPVSPSSWGSLITFCSISKLRFFVLAAPVSRFFLVFFFSSTIFLPILSKHAIDFAILLRQSCCDVVGVFFESLPLVLFDPFSFWLFWISDGWTTVPPSLILPSCLIWLSKISKKQISLDLPYKTLPIKKLLLAKIDQSAALKEGI